MIIERTTPTLKDKLLGIGFMALLVADQVHQRYVKPAAPTVVKADFGASLLVTLIVTLVVIALTELLRPKPNIEDARPAGLGDFQFPTATEGRVIPLLWGTVRLRGPNVIWYGDLVQQAITERIQTGLWSSTRITKGFRYLVGVQMGLCRGPGCVLKGVWVGDDQVFDGTVTGGNFFTINETELFGGDDLGNGGIAATVDFYSGEVTQPQNAYLAGSTDRQLINTAATPGIPANNGTCYVVVRNATDAAAAATDSGAYFGNSTSIKPWSFEVERIPALMPGQTAGQNRIGAADANPVNCLYEILTNTEWGFGFTDAEIDTASFLAAAATCATEGNGFSFVLTRQIVGTDLLSEIERQIDGIVQLDVTTGLWTLVLARFDYDINTVPQLDESNVLSVEEFSRGTWEETTNIINVKFNKRDDDYKESFATAQDMGNALIRGEGVAFKPVSAEMNFPGVKDSALAVQLAWRELRQKTYPLARVSFTLSREFFDLKVGQVIAWTDAQFGFTQLPLRVGKVDLGNLTDNVIRVTCIQDIFTFQAASFASPPPTGWTPPATTPVAFPVDEQLVIEAPRAIVVRDPNFAGNPLVAKVFASARRQGIEASYNIETRSPSGSGAFNIAQEVTQFALIGELTNALVDGTAIPTSTIQLTGTPDSTFVIEGVFNDSESLANIGQGLAHLIYVGDETGAGEFMLVDSAVINGVNVDLQNVYRGVLDTVQQAHTAGTKVWLLFVGSGLTDDNYNQGATVDVDLRPKSPRETFSGIPSRVTLTMGRRVFRPYPPAAIRWDGVDYGDMDVEANGTGLNNQNVDLTFRGRSFQTLDELVEKTTPSTIDPSTEYRIRLFWDNTELTASYWSTTSPVDWTSSIPTINVERRYLVNEASIDSEFRVEIQTRHDFEGQTDIEALQTLVHRITPTSEFNGLTYLGGGAQTLPNAYTVATDVTHRINIGTAYATANVQYRINGGSWVTVIAFGNTQGDIANTEFNVSDTIELRIDADESPIGNEVTITEIGGGTGLVAYGAFEGSGTGFLPTSIAGLTGWWDPNDATTVTTGAPSAVGEVLSLDNKAEMANDGDMVANTLMGSSLQGNRAQEFVISSGAINGRDALGDGTQNLSLSRGMATRTNANGWAGNKVLGGEFLVACVFQKNTATATTEIETLFENCLNDPGGGRFFFILNQTITPSSAFSTNWIRVAFIDSSADVNEADYDTSLANSLEDGNPHCVMVRRRNGTGTGGLDEVLVYYDGAVVMQFDLVTSGGGGLDNQYSNNGSTNVGNGRFFLGCSVNLPDNIQESRAIQSFYIGETLFYNGTITDQNAADITAYLESKWGVL